MLNVGCKYLQLMCSRLQGSCGWKSITYLWLENRFIRDQNIAHWTVQRNTVASNFSCVAYISLLLWTSRFWTYLALFIICQLRLLGQSKECLCLLGTSYCLFRTCISAQVCRLSTLVSLLERLCQCLENFSTVSTIAKVSQFIILAKSHQGIALPQFLRGH